MLKSILVTSVLLSLLISPFTIAQAASPQYDYSHLTSQQRAAVVSQLLALIVILKQALAQMLATGQTTATVSLPSTSSVPAPVTPVGPVSQFSDGTFAVGQDIQPGTYRNSGSEGCYYARLRGFGGTIKDIISNENTDAVAIVSILPADAGFESKRCGTWSRIQASTDAVPTVPQVNPPVAPPLQPPQNTTSAAATSTVSQGNAVDCSDVNALSQVSFTPLQNYTNAYGYIGDKYQLQGSFKPIYCGVKSLQASIAGVSSPIIAPDTTAAYFVIPSVAPLKAYTLTMGSYAYNPFVVLMKGYPVQCQLNYVFGYGENDCNLPIGSNSNSATPTSTQTAVAYYMISASADVGGTIFPSGQVQVKAGDSQSFSITAKFGAQNNGKVVDGVQVGGQVGMNDSYTFPSVQANHTIEAKFLANGGTDATLGGLTVSAGTLSPAFYGNTYSYTVIVPVGTTAIPTVGLRTDDPYATAVVTQTAALPGTATVAVTAQDGIEKLTYTVAFQVGS